MPSPFRQQNKVCTVQHSGQHDGSPLRTTSVDQLIVIAQTKRITALQAELKQLTESHSSEKRKLILRLAEQAAKNGQLEHEIGELRKQQIEAKEKHETEMKETKSLAASNYHSIEFEVEQHKSKAKARESELVQRIEELENKLKEVSEKEKENALQTIESLKICLQHTEVQLNQYKAQSAVDKLTWNDKLNMYICDSNAAVFSEKMRCESLQRQIDSLKLQLQENDLKSREQYRMLHEQMVELTRARDRLLEERKVLCRQLMASSTEFSRLTMTLGRDFTELLNEIDNIKKQLNETGGELEV